MSSYLVYFDIIIAINRLKIKLRTKYIIFILLNHHNIKLELHLLKFKYIQLSPAITSLIGPFFQSEFFSVIIYKTKGEKMSGTALKMVVNWIYDTFSMKNEPGFQTRKGEK